MIEQDNGDGVLLEQTEDIKPISTFGEVLGGLQSAGGRRLTWRQFADRLGVDRTHLKRIVRGEAMPTRSVDFINKVRGLPGVREDDIQRLLATPGRLQWAALAAQHYDGKNDDEHRAAIISGDGINVFVGVRLDLERYTPEELDVFAQVVSNSLVSSITIFELLNKAPRRNGLEHNQGFELPAPDTG